MLVSRWRLPSCPPPAATTAPPFAVKTADGEFWSRGAIRRRYQRRRVAPRGIAALARRLGAPLWTVRAKGPRGQDLQGTVEIRRDLRHLWPVRPSDALLHSKPTCPACSRRCRPCSPPAPSAPVFSAPPTGGSGYNGAYGYGGGDGSYSGGPDDHGGHGDANYKAVPVGQSPGAGVGYGIPSRPPAAPDRGYHRSIQQAGVGEDSVAFATEDGGHEDEAYFGGAFSSVFGGPESGHGPTAYVLQLPTSGRSSGTGCDIPRSPPQYSDSNNGYGTNRGPQQQYGSGSRSYRVKPFVRHYRGGDGTALWPQQQHGPRPFCSFGWEERGACRDGPPVNGLAHSIAQRQAQRDVEMNCHGGPVSKVSGPPERGGPTLQARHQRGLQPPSGTLSPPAAVISDSASEEWLQSNEMEMPMFSLSKGQRQQPPNSAASVGGAPASSAVAAASAETSAAEPATSGTVPSAASIRGAVDARESSAVAASSDAAAEVATPTGGTAAPVASAARAARALASAAGSVDDSWAWAISQGCLRFYPRRRVSVRRLPPRPRPIPRSSVTCARLAHSRSWGGHSNEGSTLSRPGGCFLEE